jgi:cellulose synthase/poly-beta-1,6-N-acetylglucosamine synthase-like glycosyltransferase
MEEIIANLFGLGNSSQTLVLIDATAFLFVAVSVLYLFVFALKSLNRKKTEYPVAEQKYRFAVIFPAYKEDKVILNSIQDFQRQEYPVDKYDIIVVADQMSEETNQQLRDMSTHVLEVIEEKSSKTRALQRAEEYIYENGLKYDIVVILDADNLVDTNYLSTLNNAFYSGCSVIQTHRVAKNLNSSIAILDAVSEEINNSIFRKGHTRLGFSSSLIGSGMAFEYEIYEEIIHRITDISDDKQLEIILLKDNIYIEYLNELYTYDEKIKKTSQFYSQRRRWIANQFFSLITGLKSLPSALFTGNWDYCNKLLQWAMPPRLILFGIIILFGVLFSAYDISHSFTTIMSAKWWGLLVLLMITFAMAIPDYLINSKLLKSSIQLPILFVLMFFNFFRIFGSRKKHKKSIENEENNSHEDSYRGPTHL